MQQQAFEPEPSRSHSQWANMLAAPHTEGIKLYVVGFLFRDSGREVALVRKNRPDWQRGFLNGVGGRVEIGETASQAMEREFAEEAAAKVVNWRNFGVLSAPDVPMAVALYASETPASIATKTDEEVGWYKLSELDRLQVVPNLRWIIPAAREAGRFVIARCER